MPLRFQRPPTQTEVWWGAYESGCAADGEKAFLKVFIQKLAAKNLFLNATSEWGPLEEAYEFRTPAFAVDYCMMRGLREVRVIVTWDDPEQSLFLDVHANHAHALRKGIQANRELRAKQRALRGELDAARADAKERKKQCPFKRKVVAKPGAENP